MAGLYRKRRALALQAEAEIAGPRGEVENGSDPRGFITSHSPSRKTESKCTVLVPWHATGKAGMPRNNDGAAGMLRTTISGPHLSFQ